MIKPYDKEGLKAIEKAILSSNIGLTPTNDGTVIRLNIPPLTEERRKNLLKLLLKLLKVQKLRLGILDVMQMILLRKISLFLKIQEENRKEIQDKTDEFIKK